MTTTTLIAPTTQVDTVKRDFSATAYTRFFPTLHHRKMRITEADYLSVKSPGELGNMARMLVSVLYGAVDMGHWILCTLFHGLLAVVYRGKKKTVPPVEDALLLKSATLLATQIRKGKLKSEDVVRAYIKRIEDVEPFINATVERPFQEALQAARDADSLVASGTMTEEQLANEKPLLGVPISIKVLLTVKGMKSTAASLLFRDVRAAEDAPTVALMKEAGAIILCTTNSAEMGLNFQTDNYVHGRTSNPYDTTRTSGGSSGGESALIAAAGSVLGLGNDLAGSIRMPCSFTGLFGHKPSRDMVSPAGCFPVVGPKLLRYLCTGPMCRYAEDLNTSMAILTSQNDEPPKFGQPVNFKDIKINYMSSIGDIFLVQKVDADILQALDKAVSYFEQTYGNTPKEAKIPLLAKSNLIYFHGVLSSVPDITQTLTAGKEEVHGPKELMKLLMRISNYTLGPVLAFNAHNIPGMSSLAENRRCSELLKELEEEFDKLLDEKSVLLFPTFITTAPYHYEIQLLVPSVCYSAIFNLLGLPSTQCPMGFDRHGLPIGIQIVGGRNCDPLTIACAVELEKAFGGWQPPEDRPGQRNSMASVQ